MWDGYLLKINLVRNFSVRPCFPVVDTFCENILLAQWHCYTWNVLEEEGREGREGKLGVFPQVLLYNTRYVPSLIYDAPNANTP